MANTCRTIDPEVRSCDFKRACDFVGARDSGECDFRKACTELSRRTELIRSAGLPAVRDEPRSEGLGRSTVPANLQNQIPQIEITPNFERDLLRRDPQKSLTGIVDPDLLRQSFWGSLSQQLADHHHQDAIFVANGDFRFGNINAFGGDHLFVVDEGNPGFLLDCFHHFIQRESS